MLYRRDFVHLCGAAGLGAAVGCGNEGNGGVALPPEGPSVPPSIVRGSRKEIDGDLTVVAGELPRDIEGNVLVVGGIPYGDGTPLFTGDGMVYRISFQGPRAHLKTRLIRTDDFLVDEAATDPALAFQNQGMIRMSPQLGARDFANTALVPAFDGRLLATYDAGRPWELDPMTLEPITPVGKHDAWKPFLPPINPGLNLFPVNMSTAHPVYDRDDAIVYAVNWAPPLEGLSLEPFFRVIRWDGRSEPTHTTLVDERGEKVFLEQSCHQLQTTRRYVIFSDGAFKIEGGQTTGGDVTEAQRPTTVLWVVRKEDLVDGGTAVALKVEIPVESAHFLIDRDDTGDRITVTLPHNNSSDPSEWIRESDIVHQTGEPVNPAHAGMMVSAADQSIMGRYTFDARTGEVLSEATLIDDRLWGPTLWTLDETGNTDQVGDRWWATLGFEPELLTRRIADTYRDHPHRLIPLDELPTSPVAPSLTRVDHRGNAITDHFPMPKGYLPMSPTFAPRRGGGSAGGYLVTFVVGAEADEVWIFSSDDLAYGPICRLRHPDLDIGFSLHTTWMPELRPQTPDYKVARADDYGGALNDLSGDARALVRRVLEI